MNHMALGRNCGWCTSVPLSGERPVADRQQEPGCWDLNYSFSASLTGLPLPQAGEGQA